MNRLTSRSVALLVATVVTVVAIAALRAARKPVLRRPAVSGGTTAGDADRRSAVFFERIRISMAAATTRNEQALALCDREVNAVLEREFAEIARRGEQAVDEVSTYSSCLGIIYRLAKDKVFGGSRAAEYVDTELGGRLRPTLQTCARELDIALARFDRSLAESTVTLATELAQVRNAADGGSLDVSVDLQPSGDLDTTLRNLGFNATSAGVSLSLDIWALLQSRLIGGMLSKVTGMAASMFARPAAAAAAELTVAVADGPLPFGDLIALGGGLWTASDIWATRAAFERELRTSVANALPEMQRSVHDQIMTRIHDTLDAHRRVQDSIRTASTDAVNR